MTDIPEDIMEKANELHLSLLGRGYRETVEAIAAALADERERAAKLADEIMTTADGKFDLTALRAAQGEGSLELAAACAAGMAHAAREIAAAIRRAAKD